MKIICDKCGEENLLPTKKRTSKMIRKSRISYCKNCGNKIFVPIVRRYSDEEF